MVWIYLELDRPPSGVDVIVRDVPRFLCVTTRVGRQESKESIDAT